MSRTIRSAPLTNALWNLWTAVPTLLFLGIFLIRLWMPRISAALGTMTSAISRARAVIMARKRTTKMVMTWVKV